MATVACNKDESGMIPSIMQDREGNLDFSCVLGLLAFAVFLYFSYHNYIILGKDFDAGSWGAGAGGLAAGHGAGKLMGNRGDYGA